MRILQLLLLLLVIKSFVSNWVLCLLAFTELWPTSLLACRWVKSETLSGSSFYSHSNKDLFRQESVIDTKSRGGEF